MAGILSRGKFAAKLVQKNLSASEIVSLYRAVADTVEAAPIDVPELRDPRDTAVLACALAARAEAIVSGDDDLQALVNYRGVLILSPAGCLKHLNR